MKIQFGTVLAIGAAMLLPIAVFSFVFSGKYSQNSREKKTELISDEAEISINNLDSVLYERKIYFDLLWTRIPQKTNFEEFGEQNLLISENFLNAEDYYNNFFSMYWNLYGSDSLMIDMFIYEKNSGKISGRFFLSQSSENRELNSLDSQEDISPGLEQMLKQLAPEEFQFVSIDGEARIVYSKKIVPADTLPFKENVNIDDIYLGVTFYAPIMSHPDSDTKVFAVDSAWNMADGSDFITNISNKSDGRYIGIKNIFDQLNNDVSIKEGKAYSSSEYSIYISSKFKGWSIAVYNIAPVNTPRSLALTVILVFIPFWFLAGVLAFWIFTPMKKLSYAFSEARKGKVNETLDLSRLPLGNLLRKTEYGTIEKEFNQFADISVKKKERYRLVLELTDKIIFEWDYSRNKVDFSINYMKAFPYRASDSTFEKSFFLNAQVHPSDAETFNSAVQAFSDGNDVEYGEYRFLNSHGDYVWYAMSAKVLCVSDNSSGGMKKPIKCVGYLVDINRQKKTVELLNSRASFDSLTRCFNRASIENYIADEMRETEKTNSSFALLFIDIDNFKYYNDTYSHATGDEVLRFVGIAVNRVIEEFGVLGRYGGDEFIACIRHTQINDPAESAQKILNELKNGFDSEEGGHLTVSASIGIAIVRDASQGLEEIIAQSDEAMYNVKKNGKGNYGFIN